MGNSKRDKLPLPAIFFTVLLFNLIFLKFELPIFLTQGNIATRFHRRNTHDFERSRTAHL